MHLLKQTVATAAIICAMVCLPSNQASAQNAVCVVDVAKIFESHSGFQASLEDLKQQAEQYKYSLQQRGDTLRAKSEQLRNFKVGSPEYKQLETELAQQSANLEVERRNKTREFVQAEAKLHFDTYYQVTQAIGGFCEQRGYRIALRYSNLQMNETSDPASIMQRVNEYVVFHRPQIDITQDIIRSLGGTTPQVGGRPAGSQNR